MPIPRGTKAGTIQITYHCQICDERKPSDKFEIQLAGIKCIDCQIQPKRKEHIFDDGIEKKHRYQCDEWRDLSNFAKKF